MNVTYQFTQMNFFFNLYISELLPTIVQNKIHLKLQFIFKTNYSLLARDITLNIIIKYLDKKYK